MCLGIFLGSTLAFEPDRPRLEPSSVAHWLSKLRQDA